MQMLDLANDDPEEYEGRGIWINGCLYEIGPSIGSGYEKFVHVLRNARSGLTLSTLAVYRAGLAATESITHEIAAKAVADALKMPDMAPNVMRVEIEGGILHLQDYVGQYESVLSPVHDTMMAGQSLLTAGRWMEAIRTYEAVLGVNPFHTVALNNIAYSFARLNQPVEALLYQGKAVEIEPNYLPYLRSFVQYAAVADAPFYVIEGHRDLRSKYPYDHSCDELAVSAQLDIGAPERALELLEDMSSGTPERAALIQTARAALRAKNEASPVVQSAKRRLSLGDSEGALGLLRRAFNLYSSDAEVRVNLGLLLAANGAYGEARQLLLSSTRLVSPSVETVCVVNAAFCSARSRQYQDAIELLAEAMEQLSGGTEAREVTYGDLRGLAFWVDDEGILEAPAAVSLAIVEHVIEAYRKHGEVPELVVRLAQLYRKAATAEA